MLVPTKLLIRRTADLYEVVSADQSSASIIYKIPKTIVLHQAKYLTHIIHKKTYILPPFPPPPSISTMWKKTILYITTPKNVFILIITAINVLEHEQGKPTEPIVYIRSLSDSEIESGIKESLDFS